MKARVTLKEGIRVHRLDNTFVDYPHGAVVETDDLPATDREQRLMSGHLVAVKPEVPPAASPKEPEPAAAVAKATRGRK